MTYWTIFFPAYFRRTIHHHSTDSQNWHITSVSLIIQTNSIAASVGAGSTLANSPNNIYHREFLVPQRRDWLSKSQYSSLLRYFMSLLYHVEVPLGGRICIHCALSISNMNMKNCLMYSGLLCKRKIKKGDASIWISYFQSENLCSG